MRQASGFNRTGAIRILVHLLPKTGSTDRKWVAARRLQGVGNSQRRAARLGDRDEPVVDELGARNSGPATSVEPWEPEIGRRDVKSAAGARLDSARSLDNRVASAPRATPNL
jgi:hypothetical protein